MWQNTQAYRNSEDQTERDELSLIADYLDVLRRSTPQNPSISIETATELQEYLALAEAALRRAGAEIKSDVLQGAHSKLQ